MCVCASGVCTGVCAACVCICCVRVYCEHTRSNALSSCVPASLQRMNKMFDTPVDGDDAPEHVLADGALDRRTREEISSLQSALSVMEQANKFIGMCAP